MSATCRGCGKPIVWGIDPDGKKIPLDPRAPVYALNHLPVGGDPHVERDHDSMVSHFATCSKANDFSGSKKR